jgi:hypothetical protein
MGLPHQCSKNPANNGVPEDAHAKQPLEKARLAAAALLAEEDEQEEESDEDPDSYSDKPTYSLSVVDRTTSVCNLEAHVIGHP